MVVTMMPPGSSPGMSSFAMAPATRPRMRAPITGTPWGSTPLAQELPGRGWRNPAWLAVNPGCSMFVAATPRVRERVAVRAEDHEVLKAVVLTDAVDVVQLQRDRLPTPLAEPARLARIRLESLGDQAVADLHPVAGTGEQDFHGHR